MRLSKLQVVRARFIMEMIRTVAVVFLVVFICFCVAVGVVL